MKSLLIYYSRYGNTSRVADVFLDALQKVGEVDTHQLQYLGSHKSIFKRTLCRFFPALLRLAPAPTDLSKYDLLCIGVPVWGGRPSAPVTRYLQLCRNLDKKRVICFFIYVVEPSAKQCFAFVEKILQKRGRPEVYAAYIPWQQVNSKEFVDKAVSEVVAEVTKSK